MMHVEVDNGNFELNLDGEDAFDIVNNPESGDFFVLESDSIDETKAPTLFINDTFHEHTELTSSIYKPSLFSRTFMSEERLHDESIQEHDEPNEINRILQGKQKHYVQDTEVESVVSMATIMSHLDQTRELHTESEFLDYNQPTNPDSSLTAMKATEYMGLETTNTLLFRVSNDTIANQEARVLSTMKHDDLSPIFISSLDVSYSGVFTEHGLLDASQLVNNFSFPRPYYGTHDYLTHRNSDFPSSKHGGERFKLAQVDNPSSEYGREIFKSVRIDNSSSEHGREIFKSTKVDNSPLEHDERKVKSAQVNNPPSISSKEPKRRNLDQQRRASMQVWFSKLEKLVPHQMQKMTHGILLSKAIDHIQAMKKKNRQLIKEIERIKKENANLRLVNADMVDKVWDLSPIDPH
jgi:hypothetical protein